MKPVLFLSVAAVFVGIIFWVLSSAHLIALSSSGLEINFLKNSSIKKASDALNTRNNEIKQMDAVGKTKISAIPETAMGGLFNLSCISKNQCDTIVEDGQKKICFDGCLKSLRTISDPLMRSDLAQSELQFINEYLKYYGSTDMKELDGFTESNPDSASSQIKCAKIASATISGSFEDKQNEYYTGLVNDLKVVLDDSEIWSADSDAGNYCIVASSLLGDKLDGTTKNTIKTIFGEKKSSTNISEALQAILVANILPNTNSDTAEALNVFKKVGSIDKDALDETKNNAQDQYEKIIGYQSDLSHKLLAIDSYAQLNKQLPVELKADNPYQRALTFEYATSKNNNMNLSFVGCDTGVQNDKKSYCMEEQSYLGRNGVWKNGMGADLYPAIYSYVYSIDSDNIFGYKDSANSPVAKYYAYEKKQLDNGKIYLPPIYNNEENKWEYTELKVAPPFQATSNITAIDKSSYNILTNSHFLINSQKVFGHIISLLSLTDKKLLKAF